jgi:transcription initiation factor TFIIIB Brf1 subunit/transcription initiation factor TFIIB
MVGRPCQDSRHEFAADLRTMDAVCRRCGLVLTRALIEDRDNGRRGYSVGAILEAERDWYIKELES